MFECGEKCNWEPLKSAEAMFRRKWETCLALLTACASGPAETATNQCSLNGRVMSAVSTICSDTLCTRNLPTRVQVLGDKVLYYVDPSASTGFVFVIGKHVDLTGDYDAMSRRANAAQTFSEMGTTIDGFASVDGTKVTLQQIIQPRDATNSELNTTKTTETIDARDCSSCTLTEYTMEMTNKKYGVNETFHLSSQTCKFVG